MTDNSGSNSRRRSSGDLVKLSLPTDPESSEDSATETVWAEHVGSNRYRIKNSPFYAYGLSSEDIVFGREIGGILTLDGISIRGGHSTYRIRRARDQHDPEFERLWSSLEDLGCSYEGGPGLLWAIDIPPQVDIYEAYEILEEGERQKIWEFEEGHCGHPLRS